MKDIERDDLVEIAAQTRCAVCKTPYGRHGVHVLGRRSGAWIIAVTCPHCGAEGLMVAAIDRVGSGDIVRLDKGTDSKAKIMYDVTYDEWLAFQKKPPISHDDVLDIHLFLKDFDGDFQRLFQAEANATEEDVK